MRNPPHARSRLAALSIVWLACLLPASGCWWSDPDREVVVYAAQDAEFSEPIFAEFQRRTEIRVLPKFDTESTKTVGLAAALRTEAGHPRCDVFWNNEILNTLRLEQAGLLDRYDGAPADDFPAAMRSRQNCWWGFAARARVLIVNTDLVPPDQRPTSIEDLADARWRGRTGLAKPLFGTTATHAACLFAHWGDERAEAFFESLKANQVQILAGNRHVARSVGQGQLAFGLTDTDDALAELELASPVEIVYPDGGDAQMGTLFIPNTLAIVKGCPRPAAARRLVNYLLSAEVETLLAEGPSGQIPLNPSVRARLRVETPQTVKAMDVDFYDAAAHWDRTAKYLRRRFAAAD